MAEILIIDTSTDAVIVSCGMSSSDAYTAVMQQHSMHSENILLAVREVLGHRKVSLGELDAIGVGIGPGLFTGLRVGITAAHSFAHACDLPLVYLSSLELGACASTDSDKDVMIARDARRGELYRAHYHYLRGQCTSRERDGVHFASRAEPIIAESLISPSEWAHDAAANSATLIFPSGAYDVCDEISDAVQTRRRDVIYDARDGIDIVREALSVGILANVNTPTALYIRKSDAELSWGTS